MDGVGRGDPFGEPLAVRTAHGDEDDQADEQPGGTAVAGARMGHDRDHPDREGEDRPDDRRNRDLGAADRDVERRPVRPRQVGRRHPQLDHGDLGRGEREQDAEREHAREERDVVIQERRGDHDRARDRRDGDDRLRRDERAPVQAAERRGSWPCSPSEYASRAEAGDGGRHGGEQDQRAADPDEEPDRVAERPIRVRPDLVGDADERRAQPASCRARCAGPGTPRAATTAIAT